MDAPKADRGPIKNRNVPPNPPNIQKVTEEIIQVLNKHKVPAPVGKIILQNIIDNSTVEEIANRVLFTLSQASRNLQQKNIITREQIDEELKKKVIDGEDIEKVKHEI